MPVCCEQAHAQVLVSGFSNEVNVGSLVQREHPEGPSSGAAGCSEPCYELCHTHTLVGHLAASPAVAVTPGGLAVSASFDGTLRLWQLPQVNREECTRGMEVNECLISLSGGNV